MSMQTIRHAAKTIWPEVQKSLAIHNERRVAVRDNPERFSTAAKKRATRGWSKVVSEETIWAIAKADLLAGPEHAAVIEAAKRWATTWDDTPSSEMEPEDRELYNAIHALTATEEYEDIEVSA